MKGRFKNVGEAQLKAMNGHGGLRLTLQLSTLTALQILFAFAIQIYTVIRLGAGTATDALAVSYTIPQVIATLITEPMLLVLVPLLATRSEEELQRDGWDLFVSMGVIFGAIVLGIYALSSFVIPILAPGFGSEAKALTISLTKIQMIGVLGNATYVILAALYQVRGRFITPALALVVAYVLGFLLLTWRLSNDGIRLAAWVQTIVNIAPAVLLLPILGRFTRHINLELFKQVLRHMRPLVFGAAYYKTGYVVDRLLGSFLAPGSIVILDIAQRTYGAIERTVNQGMVTPIVPQLSKLAADEQWHDFRNLHRRKLLEMLLVNGSVVVGIVLFSFLAAPRIIDLLPSHNVLGHLTPENLETLFLILVLMSGRLLSSGLNHTLTTAFYAQRDTATPVRLAAVSYTVGIVAKVFGYWSAGLFGIAVAISLFNVLNCVMLVWSIRPGLFQKAENRDASDNVSHRTVPAALREMPGTDA